MKFRTKTITVIMAVMCILTAFSFSVSANTDTKPTADTTDLSVNDNTESKTPLSPKGNMPAIDDVHQITDTSDKDTIEDKQFITVESKNGNVFYIKGNQKYRSTDVSVEGDWSNAAFLLALNELGGNVTVNGLDSNSRQGDKKCVEYFRALKAGTPRIDISGTPDLAPVLFTLASAKNGAVFTGTKRLAIKESDRAAVMAEELRKFGAEVTVSENEVVIDRTTLRCPQENLDSHNDHRVVMSLSALALTTGGTITGAEAINKSYPDFFENIKALGAEVRLETE